MARERKYATAADRAKAYRERKKLERKATAANEADPNPLLVALYEGFLTAAEAGFLPAAKILVELKDNPSPERLLSELAIWLKFQAANWEMQEKWENRRSGWDAAWEWHHMGTTSEEIHAIRERTFRYWDEEREDLPGYREGPTFREIHEENARLLAEKWRDRQRSSDG